MIYGKTTSELFELGDDYNIFYLQMASFVRE